MDTAGGKRRRRQRRVVPVRRGGRRDGAGLVGCRARRRRSSGPESAWSPLAEGGGSVTASIDEDEPLNDQITRSLRLDVGSVGAGQRVGMTNTGYFGIPAVAGETCRVSFWAKAAADLATPVTRGHREGRRLGHDRRPRRWPG